MCTMKEKEIISYMFYIDIKIDSEREAILHATISECLECNIIFMKNYIWTFYLKKVYFKAFKYNHNFRYIGYFNQAIYM